MIWIGLLLIISLVSQGFYTTSNWMYMALAIFIISLLVFVYNLISGKARITLKAIPLFVIPILYMATLLSGVESVDGTIRMALNWLMVACAGTYFFSVASKRHKKISLHYILVFMSYFVSVVSFLVIFKVIRFPDYILELGKTLSGSGFRIGGFFQYPNAFGAVVGVFFLFMLLITLDGKYSGKLAFLYPMILPSLGFIFICTESRGAWLAFSIGWIVSLFIQKDSNVQLKAIIYTLLSFLIGGLGYIIISVNGILHPDILFILILIAGSILLGWLYRLSFFSFPIKAIPVWAIPSLLIIAGILLAMDILNKGAVYSLLPKVLQRRLAMGGLDTLLERFVYVKDMFTRPDLFMINGAGGSGWDTIMYQVQSAPYISHELHNGYANWLLELGCVGLAFNLCLVILVVIYMAKRRSIVLPVFLILVLHGFIDFTFSYTFTILLALLLIAISIEHDDVEKHRNPWNLFFERHKVVRILVSSIFVLFLVLGSIYNYKFIQGNSWAEKALQSNDENQYVQDLEQAIKENPYNPVYRLDIAKAQNLNTNQKIDILNKGLTYEPHHALLMFNLGELYYQEGDTNKAFKMMEDSLKMDHFDKEKYQRFMSLLVKESIKDEKNGEKEQSYKWSNQALKVFSQAKLWDNKVKMMDADYNQRHYNLTKEMLKDAKTANRLNEQTVIQ